VLFVDTSFWVALSRRGDRWHNAAAELIARHGDRPMVTSNMVRGETWTVLRSRNSHGVASKFFDLLAQSPRVELVHVGWDLEEQAVNWLRRHDERLYSFVDATSFALMRERRITEVLAFDNDFSAAGFVELRP
jgi:predicted nucleic acid-binding protein